MAQFINYINTLIAGESLTQEGAGELLDMIFSGDIAPAQVAGFLTALRIKGPIPAEIAGFAGSLRSHARKVIVNTDNLIDTCGTGGGSVKTCNVSTAAAIIGAGAGLKVAKHGNRGITSACGSADVLEALGVKIDAEPKRVSECIKEAGVGFMFAPIFHPAMKYVQPVRKELGFRTVFNILGPLANPAGANAQVLGVADESLMETMIISLQMLDTQRAMVVHSSGLDEISNMGPTKIMHLNQGKVTRSTINPQDLGIAQASAADLQAVDAQDSAKIMREIVSGINKSAKRDIVLLNAAAAIIVGQLADDFKSALKIAQDSIDSGKAQQALEKLIELSNK